MSYRTVVEKLADGSIEISRESRLTSFHDWTPTITLNVPDAECILSRLGQAWRQDVKAWLSGHVVPDAAPFK